MSDTAENGQGGTGRRMRGKSCGKREWHGMGRTAGIEDVGDTWGWGGWDDGTFGDVMWGRAGWDEGGQLETVRVGCGGHRWDVGTLDRKGGRWGIPRNRKGGI